MNGFFKHLSVLLTACLLVTAGVSKAATVDATFNTAADVAVTAATYTATGNTINLTLNFAPPTGTSLTVIKKTGPGFIQGIYDNLAHGQRVNLSFGGITYPYFANYFGGGSGRDLVLQWANTRILSWGYNDKGQLGLNRTVGTSLVPTAVDMTGILSGKSIVAMAAGDRHCLVLCSDGTLAAWGDNQYGQLGNSSNTTNGVFAPVLVDRTGVLNGKTIIAIAAGTSHSLALCSDGTLAAWGLNGSGQLGNNVISVVNSSPLLVDQSGALSGKSVVSIGAGTAHSLAYCSDSSVYLWGANAVGQLGNGTTVASKVPVALNTSGVLAASAAASVVTVGYHNLAQCVNGRDIASWGYNSDGQLGNGSTNQSSLPVLVNRLGVLAGKSISRVSAGASHSLVLCTDGSLATWGANNLGMLGNNSTTAKSTPVSVVQNGVLNGKVVTFATATANCSLALCSDGTMTSWGYNAHGELGNNSTTNSTVPVVVNSSAIASGERPIVMLGGGLHNFAIVASPPPAIVTVAAATGVSDTGAVINGTVNAQGSTTQVSIEYGLTLTYGYTKATSPASLTGASTQAVTANLTGLLPGILYHFRLVATNGGGTVRSEDMTFTTTTFATLSNLTLDSTFQMPGFSKSIDRYSTTVPNTTTGISVIPTATWVGATVTVNGLSVASGVPSAPVSLSIGGNTIEVSVTAAGGGNSKVYSIVVTRLPASLTFTSPMVPPVTVEDFPAEGLTANFSLNFAPPFGTSLAVVTNTGNRPIQGTFSNVAQGQFIYLSFGGYTYRFVANYFGGSGNDLVLQWASMRLLSCGDNVNGQLGNNTQAQSNVPVSVFSTGALSGKIPISISTGETHSIVVCSDGTLLAWGNNLFGRLGNNSTTSSIIPTLVDQTGVLAGKRVVKVSAGLTSSLALCSDGTTAAWGNNTYGQLGNNDTATRLSPVLIDSQHALLDKAIVDVSLGGVHGIALCTDGSVAAWGGGVNGQLGNGIAANSSTPVLVDRSGVLNARTVVALYAGGSHSIALCSDGRIAGWGYNYYGQLGNNGTNQVGETLPVLVDNTGVLAGKTVIAISAGGNHSLALCSDGTLAAWGYNANGQLGNNSTTDSPIPVLVTRTGILSGKTVTSISAGISHSLAVCSDGSVAAWGYSNNGQLGSAIGGQSLVPVLVNSSSLKAGERFAAGSSGPVAKHNLFLAGAAPPPAVVMLPATSIKGTSATINALVSANAATTTTTFEYGLSTLYGSSGEGTPPSVSGTGDATVGMDLSGLSPGTIYHYRATVTNANGTSIGPDATFTTLSDNANLASLSLSTGSLYPAFTKTTSDYIATVPFSASGVTLTPIKDHPGATIKVNGSTVSSGTPSASIPLAVGNTTITTVVTAEDTIATKTYTVVVTRLPENLTFNSVSDIPVTANGFSTGGYPVNVVLGYAPTPGTILTAVRNTDVAFIQGRFSNLSQGQRINLTFGGLTYAFVVNYFGGSGNDLVLQWADTKAYGWGLNSYGQLGDASTTRRLIPAAVDDSGELLGKTITSLGSGYLHSLALCSDGTLAAWGYNIYGQLGDGGNAPVNIPQTVNQGGVLSGRTVVAISAGPFHNLALCSDGTVTAWGYNNYGQLGTGDKITARSPVLVSSSGALSGKQVVAVAAGTYNSFALCSDGTVAAWGYNDEGELGDNTTTSSLIPVAVNTTGVLSGKKVMTLSAGAYHTLALCTDGTLVSWGYNANGQLGNNSTSFSKVPVAIQSSGSIAGKTVTSLASGSSHSLALCSDGSLSGWGSNTQGQLGSSGASQVPKLVNLGAVGTGKSISRIAAGSSHSSVTFADGTAASWGGNSNGQLANNSTTANSTPGAVDASAFASDTRLMDISTGSASNHVVGLLALPSARASAQLALAATDGDLDIADPDHDGICNLLEYAFGLDPNADSSGLLPQPVRSDTSFAITFVEPSEVIGLTYGAEWSPSLLPDSWTPLPDQGTGRNHVFSLPIQDYPKAFIRLKVTRP